MKQHTTPEQTAKLIELGFEKPKSAISYSYPVQSEGQQAYEASLGLDPYLATVDQTEFEYAYSIGELFEMLPQAIDFGGNDLLYPLRVVPTVGGGWAISYCNEYDKRNNELIDALYDMVISLKDDGVI